MRGELRAAAPQLLHVERILEDHARAGMRLRLAATLDRGPGTATTPAILRGAASWALPFGALLFGCFFDPLMESSASITSPVTLATRTFRPSSSTR